MAVKLDDVVNKLDVLFKELATTNTNLAETNVKLIYGEQKFTEIKEELKKVHDYYHESDSRILLLEANKKTVEAAHNNHLEAHDKWLVRSWRIFIAVVGASGILAYFVPGTGK